MRKMAFWVIATAVPALFPLSALAQGGFVGPASAPPAGNAAGIFYVTKDANWWTAAPAADKNLEIPTRLRVLGDSFFTNAVVINDLYMTSGWTIRVDTPGDGILNMANFAGSNKLYMNIRGGFNVDQSGNPPIPSELGRDGRVQARKFCFQPGNPADCITTWPAGGGADPTKVLKAGDTMSGALSVPGVTNTGNETVAGTETVTGRANLNGGATVANGQTLCLGGVCNSSWPAGGGADPTKVLKAGDTMTGALILNAGATVPVGQILTVDSITSPTAFVKINSGDFGKSNGPFALRLYNSTIRDNGTGLDLASSNGTVTAGNLNIGNLKVNGVSTMSGTLTITAPNAALDITGSGAGAALYVHNNGVGYGAFMQSASGDAVMLAQSGAALATSGKTILNSSANPKLAIGGNGTDIYGTDVWVENNMHVQGNEGSYNGGRSRLRIGSAWGMPGMYADVTSYGYGSDLTIGASSGRVRVNDGYSGSLMLGGKDRGTWPGADRTMVYWNNWSAAGSWQYAYCPSGYHLTGWTARGCQAGGYEACTYNVSGDNYLGVYNVTGGGAGNGSLVMVLYCITTY